MPKRTLIRLPDKVAATLLDVGVRSGTSGSTNTNSIPGKTLINGTGTGSWSASAT